MSAPRGIPTLIGLAALALLGAAFTAQVEEPIDVQVAMAYHRLTGDTLDLAAFVERGEAVRRASSFDRRDVAAAEVAAWQQRLEGADPARELLLRVNDHVTDYDHDRGEFSIQLFTPGYNVPLDAFGQRYQLVFANAESARRIPMPRELARDFDARLAGLGRSVTNEIRFRVIGAGDPAGAVTGPRVVRAEIVGARLLDRVGNVVYEPTVAPVAAVAAGGTAGGAGADPGAAFDAATADVAGLRVGVGADDLEASLARLYGPVTRGGVGEGADPRLVAILEVNSMGCFHLPGARRKSPEPGDVCVTAHLDADDVVRAIRVERVFPPMQGELFRETMVRRYGPVAAAAQGSGYTLAWGPAIDAALSYDRSAPRHALTAHYLTNDDFMSRGLNRLPQIRVVLHLVDATWAAERGS